MREVESQEASSAEAWKVWAAWQGSAVAVAAIARQVERHTSSIECIVEVPNGKQTFDPDDLATDIPRGYLRSIKRIVISGSTSDGGVEAELDNERSMTPGRGVTLRVWARDADKAVATRDEIAVAIDGGRGPLCGEPISGPPSSGGIGQALSAVSEKRKDKVELIAIGVVLGLMWGAAVTHRLVDPRSSSLADLLLFCWCNKVIFFGMSAVAFLIAWYAIPRIFPPIEISERSTWHRVRTRLWTRIAALGVVGYGLSTAVHALDKLVH